MPSFFSWALKKFKGTVINDIWLELFFFTCVATMVCLVSEYRTPLGINNQLLAVLGTVLGLVISFRTSSAYDRYWEGRKLWSSIALASRVLAQNIWLHVPNDRKTPAGQVALPPTEARLRAIIEKRSMINLVQAYSVSMKHYLRGEQGIFYEDLYPLVSWLPKFSTEASPPPPPVPSSSDEGAIDEKVSPAPVGRTDDGVLPLWWGSPSAQPTVVRKPRKAKSFNPEQVLPQVHTDIPLKPARNPPKEDIWEYLPFLLPFRWLAKLMSKTLRDKIKASGDERDISGKRIQPKTIEGNVPLEVALYLSAYLAFLLERNLLSSALATSCANMIQSFQDSLTHLSRIRNTPIPYAYQIHLRMSTWLYLTFLPFQVYNALGWITIPATLFASFLILGFLEIGQEIENPFSYEPNDLDMDAFCLEIQRHLHEITTHAILDPNVFIFSEQNQPFAPGDRRSALEILDTQAANDDFATLGMHAKAGTLRDTLVRNWKEVNEVTREAKFKIKK